MYVLEEKKHFDILHGKKTYQNYSAYNQNV